LNSIGILENLAINNDQDYGNYKSMDIDDRKAIIRDPKRGKEAEVMFLPQKVADRTG